ncbi:MAG: HipA domain-containing protein [Clostridia bacterium]|nr:HipA domain-containing protein [Clostridia bacterium]
MRCVCCGRTIRGGGSGFGWHGSCVRAFFGTRDLPSLDIDDDTIKRLAEESTNKGYTVPGVQKKLSLHLSDPGDGDKPRLTLINYPAGFILKPQTEEYKNLPEAEHLVMSMARAARISVVPFALLDLKGKLAYITKRVDRKSEGGDVRLLAMEDFCQLDDRLTQDKYKGSYERCAGIIKKFSCRPGLDLAEFFVRVVFSFAVGNSDMHLKNFSLIETDTGRYALSPAYDLLPVNVILPEDTEQLALTLNGKKRNIRKKDFTALADNCGIPLPAAEKMISGIVACKETFFSLCDESFMPDEMKEKLKELITERLKVLE